MSSSPSISVGPARSAASARQSLGRAEFIAEAVGSGFISGAASGLAMGLGIGLVSRAVPAIGPVIGGAMALHGLVGRDWAETGATIGRFGEGNSTYEMLANTIASVAAVIDVVSQVLTVINGIVGIVQIAAAVIAGGAVVAAFFTFGATLGIAAVAADVVAVCEEISLGINAVTAVLDTVNAAILQPCVTLFRALHAFTTQADPREVEAQGHSISTAAANSGAALGAWAGGRAAHIGAGGAIHPRTCRRPRGRRTKRHRRPRAMDRRCASRRRRRLPPHMGRVDRRPLRMRKLLRHCRQPTLQRLRLRAPRLYRHRGSRGDPAADRARGCAARSGRGIRAACRCTSNTRATHSARDGGTTTPPPRRPLTPDEVAPAGTNSAYLRRLAPRLPVRPHRHLAAVPETLPGTSFPTAQTSPARGSPPTRLPTCTNTLRARRPGTSRTTSSSKAPSAHPMVAKWSPATTRVKIRR